MMKVLFIAEIVSLNIRTILEYYAILCLILIPFMLITLIILSRKTDLIDRLDRYIDKLAGINPELKPESQVLPSQSNNDPEKRENAEGELIGVTVFSIPVGTYYKCYLNFQNRNGSIGQMLWFVNNEFLGEIKKDGMFFGKKTGTVDIFCVGKGSAYESGAQAYSIRILPTDTNWFADKVISDISARTPKMDILTKYLKRKIVNENPDKGILSYAGSEAEKSKMLSFQFDKTGKMSKAVYYFDFNGRFGDETLKKLIFDIEERLEPVKLENAERLQIWIHQIIDKQRDEVDYYAFLYESEKGLFVFGIGQSWRDYGEKEEFMENIQMAMRQFADLCPEIRVGEIKAKYEPEKRFGDENESDVPPKEERGSEEKSDGKETKSEETRANKNKKEENWVSVDEEESEEEEEEINTLEQEDVNEETPEELYNLNEFADFDSRDEEEF